MIVILILEPFFLIVECIEKCVEQNAEDVAVMRVVTGGDSRGGSGDDACHRGAR
jgi:hypothetical protein